MLLNGEVIDFNCAPCLHRTQTKTPEVVCSQKCLELLIQLFDNIIKFFYF